VVSRYWMLDARKMVSGQNIIVCCILVGVVIYGRELGLGSWEGYRTLRRERKSVCESE
jgi:hypothetical protein